MVDDGSANLKHGNQVASLICQGHAWNNNRPLPNLDCTFISAKAICKDSAPKFPTHYQLIKYLELVAEKTKGESHVWNLSFNQITPSKSAEEISYLGHEISRLAREFNFLPVISIGNKSTTSPNERLCPPADCEAALTVSGRTFISDSEPLGPSCSVTLKGPAAAGMKKPDLSWYSKLRVIGGVVEKGTSFSTPLVSSLAAHAFHHLKEPTPDLVRALLINKSELDGHSNTLGWGTPWDGNNLPWTCGDGTVTLAWTAKLRPGFSYYWDDIPIPPEMIKDGKFVGTAALTAVLRPLVSDSVGENYFASRLQTSLQATARSGSTVSLAGSMREHIEKEGAARTELAKWSPIRHHVKSHKGTGFQPGSVRLYSRIFTRDLYQFDLSHHSEVEEQEVAFVLTFKSEDPTAQIYDSLVQALKNDIESAVVDQEINIES